MPNLFENERRSLFNIYDDWVFHYIFSKDTERTNRALIGILNIILNRADDPIRHIEIMNPIVQGEKEDDKDTILDIRATTKSGENFDVEMQNGKLDCFENRSLFYAFRLGNSSLEKSQNYGKMEKSIVISIVNGKLFPSSKKLHTTFKVLEETEHFLLSDRMEIHFIDLSKIDGKTDPAEMSPLEILAAYIKYAGKKDKEKYLESLLAAGGETLDMVEKLFKELTEDQIAFEKRERELKGMLDRNTALYAAEERGVKMGEERGIKMGEERGIKMGEERLSDLFAILTKNARSEDAVRAMSDIAFREELYKEFGL